MLISTQGAGFINGRGLCFRQQLEAKWSWAVEFQISISSPSIWICQHNPAWHKPQFSTSSVISCVPRHTHPNTIHFLCKPFLFTSNKKLRDPLQWWFTPCLQHFSQFNPPVDRSYFKIGPALSWLDDMTQTSVSTQFFLGFYEGVVITAVIKMPWPWKAMGSSLWMTFMMFGLCPEWVGPLTPLVWPGHYDNVPSLIFLPNCEKKVVFL